MRFPTYIAIALVVLPSMAPAQTLDDKIQAAMAADIRTAEEVERDRNRRPLETLNFFRLRDDMKVLELIPGGGWYSKILAPVLRDNGDYHAAIGTDRLRDNLLGMAGMDRANVIELDIELVRDGEFGTRSVAPFDLGEDGFDLVLTFRNMHNFTADGRNNINAAVYAALKPGGFYGVVDHTKRHMEPLTAENRRRADPVQIIQEAQQAGFVLVDFSDLHYRADDELRFEVGRKSVTGNSDRFTLLFQRPL